MNHAKTKRNLTKITTRHKTLAFTLIELLVVISIIGIIASLVLIGLRSARNKAYEVQTKADIRSIGNALQVYAMDNNEKYPLANGNSSGHTEKLQNGSATGGLLGFSNVPVPKNGQNYLYCPIQPDGFRVISPPNNEGKIFVYSEGGIAVEDSTTYDDIRCSPSLVFNGLRNPNGSIRDPIPAFSYVICPNSSVIEGRGPFSVSLWVKRNRDTNPPDDPDSYNFPTDPQNYPNDFIISQGKGMFGDYYIFFNRDNNVVFRMGGHSLPGFGMPIAWGPNLYSSKTILPTDKKWHHIVVTRDNTGKSAKMWIDNVEVASSTDPVGVYLTKGPVGEAGDDHDQFIYTYIGAMSWYRNGTLPAPAFNGDGNRQWPFKGNIDEVRTYTKELSVAEIDRLYNGTNTATDDSDPNLKAYWKFDEGSGSTISDSSGHGNSCTLQNSTWQN